MSNPTNPLQATVLKPKLLPPPEGHCRICARDHEPHMPHDAQTLFYAVRFRLRYSREGTWADAVAHCTPEIRQQVEQFLRSRDAWTEPPEGIEPIAEPIDG